MKAEGEKAAGVKKQAEAAAMGTASGCVCVHLAWADGSSGAQSICMHSEELQTAATKGDTKTVVELLARGADVHCKDKDGCGSRDSIVVSLVCDSAGRTVRPLGGGAAGVPDWAVQVDGAALGVAVRSHGDGGGAGQGGRGRALRGQQRVRLLVAASSCRWFAAVRDGRSVHSRWEQQEFLVGCAAIRRYTMRRRTATRRRRWRWSRRARTCTARAATGTVSLAGSLCRLVWHSTGRTVPSTRGGAAGVPVLAVQEDGAPMGVVERPQGDGAGLRALQGR
jgi:hypothetical protein